MKTIKWFIAMLLCILLCAHLILLAQPPPTKRQKRQNGRVPHVVLGTIEPDYKFPWVVYVDGTRFGKGVLIAPRWVLTAAHNVETSFVGVLISYSRKDPVTGMTTSDKQQTGLGSVFIHPDYVPGRADADLALVRLPKPFPPDPFLRPAELPIAAAAIGQVGTVASHSHTGPLPAGHVAVLRAPIWSIGGKSFRAKSPDASLCPGDSGSGFVTRIWTKGPTSLPWDREPERGLNVVTGIASLALVHDCISPNQEFEAVDVYQHLSWIRSTSGIPNELTVQFSTGDDDLRGGNDNVNLEVLLRAGAPLRFKNVNGGKHWGNNSINTILLILPPTLKFEDIVGVRLEITFGGSIGCDNWNLNRLIVSVRSGGQSRKLFDKRGNSLYRFMGDRRVCEFRF